MEIGRRQSVADIARQIDKEFTKRLTYREPTEPNKSVDQPFAPTLQANHPDFHDALRNLTAVRVRASNETSRLTEVEKSTRNRLFCLTLLAAALIHLFAHWHPQSHAHHPVDGHESLPWMSILLGAAAIILAGGGLVLFCLRHSRQISELAHDYRALAEGLRVQFYWNLVGLGKSVSANYMQRQRSELDWIRSAIRSSIFPYSKWADWFDALTNGDKILALRCTHFRWIDDQIKYFGKSKTYHHLLHAWHKLGGMLALAAVGTFALLCVSTAVPEFWYGLRENRLSLLLWPGFVLGFVFLLGCLARRFDLDAHRCRGWLDGVWWIERLIPRIEMDATVPLGLWSRRRLMVLNFIAYLPTSITLTFAALILSDALACFPHLPNAFDLGIVLAGWFLLGGALAIAWAEKNLLSEHAYQYSTMLFLFSNARSRLLADLAFLEDHNADAPAFANKWAEVQSFLYDLGKEALDENAEWLILHRARPLEPIMAG